ncbi:MAG: cytochrome c oxidase assembly protein [Burkholderiales bacterium]
MGAAALAGASILLYQSFGSRPATQSPSAESAPDYRVSVKFDASVGSGMPWIFEGPRNPIHLPLGQQARVFFTATNPSAEPVLGSAVFNVVPHAATPYFKKVQCFCFTEQLLMPGEHKQMPVAFIIDPAIARDSRTKETREIFASYTFFNMGTEARDKYLEKRRASRAKE